MSRERCFIYSMYWAATEKPIFPVCSTYGPYFDPLTTQDNLIGKLTVGNLMLTTGTIGDYVIEWRLNSYTGEIVFLTGSAEGIESGLNDIHAFEDQPVATGVLYPVIRWIEIDDIKYSPYQTTPNSRYAVDLLDCLDPFNVDIYTCINGGTGTYAHTIDYDWENPVGEEGSSRVVQFEVDSFTNYVAFSFDGDIIVDKLDVYYISGETETLVDSYAAGSNASKNGLYNGVYYFKSSFSFKTIIDLTSFTFVSGDYIEFRITGSWEQPTEPRTIWHLSMVCLETLDFLADCQPIDPDWNKIDPCSVTATMNVCDLNVQWNRVAPKTFTPDFTDYMYISSTSGNGLGSGFASSSTSTFGITVYTGTNSFYPSASGGITYPTQNEGLVHVTQASNTITIDFENANDYNDWITNFNAAKAKIELTWINDDTQYQYYQGYQVLNRETCADGATQWYLKWFYSSPITFTASGGAYGAGRIYIQPSIPTNNYPDVPICDNSEIHIDIDGAISSWNTIRSAVQSYTYDCEGGSYRVDYTRITLQIPSYYYQISYSNYIPTYLWNNLCTLSSPPWCFIDDALSSDGYDPKNYLTESYRVVITDTNDPVNNFEIYSFGDAETCSSSTTSYIPVFPTDYTLVYKIVAGVRTIPALGECEEDINVPQTDYGYLYNWWAASATGTNGITSSDSWLVARASDYTALMLDLNDYNDIPVPTYNNNSAGGFMKNPGTTYWTSDNTDTPYSEFDGRGSGQRDTTGVYASQRTFCPFMTSDLPVFSLPGEARLDTSNLVFRVNYGGTYNYFSHKGVGAPLRLVNPTTSLSSGEYGTYVGNDGKVYPTKCIDDREWILCNLEETKYRNDSSITYIGNLVSDDTTWATAASNQTAAYCPAERG